MNPLSKPCLLHGLQFIMPYGTASGGIFFTVGNENSNYSSGSVHYGPAWSSIRTIGVNSVADATLTVYGILA